MEYETYADVIDAYNADNMGYSTLTDYIKGQNIKIKEIEMDPIGDMQKIFENKADGGMIGIEVKIADEMAKGGRVGLFSGGALKGIASLFKAGKDKIADFAEIQANKKMFRSKDDIPLSTYSEMKGPIKLSDMENIPEDQLKKILRTQELGLYEETPELLKAANLLERFTKKVGGKRVIDYERAEAILGVKLKGNETLDDLFKIEFETRPEMRADGGRVGLFMGGDPLTGQALSIYESMNKYGFSDQEIADALRQQGLYDVAPAVETPVTNTATNIINQGGGDKDNPPPPKDPYAGLGYSSANFGLGQGINKDAVMDYEADAYEIGRTPLGQLSRFGVGIVEALKNIPTPLNLVRKGIEFAKQKQIEKQKQEEAAARDLARELQQQNIANQTGGYQFGYDKGSDFMSGGTQGQGGYDNTEAGIGAASAAMGSFKKGGLATMFTRRR